VKSYNQYCPIARSSEILAQRWTPIIIRNLLNGPTAYNRLADQAPGIPRSLLTSRLRELQSAQLVTKTQNPDNQGNLYQLTEAGQDLAPVITAMGEWGERWLDVAPQHADPVYFLNSWITSDLNHDALPNRRVTVRFDFTDQPAKVSRMWSSSTHNTPKCAARTPDTKKTSSSQPNPSHSPNGTSVEPNGTTKPAAAVSKSTASPNSPKYSPHGTDEADGQPPHTHQAPAHNRQFGRPSDSRKVWTEADYRVRTGRGCGLSHIS
jgi:DNA-binding HxlR family transcriptional regulator